MSLTKRGMRQCVSFVDEKLLLSLAANRLGLQIPGCHKKYAEAHLNCRLAVVLTRFSVFSVSAAGLHPAAGYELVTFICQTVENNNSLSLL